MPTGYRLRSMDIIESKPDCEFPGTSGLIHQRHYCRIHESTVPCPREDLRYDKIGYIGKGGDAPVAFFSCSRKAG
jgi:hypothetical protein